MEMMNRDSHAHLLEVRLANIHVMRGLHKPEPMQKFESYVL